MDIINLADRMTYFNTVVDWLFDEWGRQNSNRNFWESWVKSSLGKAFIPQTYIALEHSEPIGTFSLWRCDLQSRQDLFPWFGGLYIERSKRSQGYGKALQKAALSIAFDLGHDELFLFTNIKNYYETLGWIFMDIAPDEEGELVRIYKHKTGKV